MTDDTQNNVDFHNSTSTDGTTHHAYEALEQQFDVTVVRAHKAYIEAHFADRRFNFGWGNTYDGMSSKLYADETYPLMYVTSHLVDGIIWHTVNGYLVGLRPKEETAGVSGSLSHAPHGDHVYDVFFHLIGIAARCYRSDTTVTFDLGTFWVAEFPGRGMQYVPPNAEDVLLRVEYEASGASHITLDAHVEFGSEEVRDHYMKLLLPTLSEIAAHVRQTDS